MDIKLIDQDKKNNLSRFLITKANAAYVNTLRRIMVSEVPTMAIEEIEFKANNSILYDEMIALRLGLIPLTTDLKAYNLPAKCTCKGAGCARCQLKLTLKAKGPKTVYSEDIKTKDQKVKPVHNKILIVNLLEGQNLEFAATATLGTGDEHTKWSPGLIFHRNSASIKIGKTAQAEKIAKSCPKNVFESKSNKLSVNDKKLIDCDLCEACIQVAEKGSLEVKPNEDEFILTIESWGQLSPKDIVEKAVGVLDEKLQDFKKLV